MNVSDPCINECLYNHDLDFCEGCGRTLLEISEWFKMDHHRRAIVDDARKKRLKIAKN